MASAWPHQVLGLQLVLVGEEPVVHLPEAALRGRGLGRLGGELGPRVDVRERQVAHDVAQVVAEPPAQRRAQAGGARAEGALEVQELHQGERRVDRPPDVVVRGVHRRVEDGGPEHAALGARPDGDDLEDAPPQQRRDRGGRQHADLRLVPQLRRREREVHDEQRDREADARRARPRRATSAGPTPRGSWPRRARAATRLVAPTPISLPTTRPRMTPRPTRRGPRVAQRVPVDLHARVGQGEERHDHEARPGVQQLLEPLVGRHGALDAELGRAGELRHRRLAEGLRQHRRPLDLLAPRRVHGDAHGDQDPGDGRVDPRLEHRRPQHRAHQEVGRAAPHLQPAERQDHQHARPGQQERQHRHVVGVEERDDRQRGDVVHDRQRQQEDPQLGGRAGAHQREHAEGEGGVGRDRDPPALRRVARRVEGQVERRRHHDPRAGGERRDPQAHPVGQLAHRHLAAHLEPHDEEEEHHQPVVDPVLEVLGDGVVAEADRELG